MPRHIPSLSTRRLAIGTLAGVALTALVAAAPAKPAAERWSATISTSPIGALLVGKPGAKVKLVEYFSYTCSHCADFAKQSAVLLKTLYIDTGLVQSNIAIWCAIRSI